MSDLTVDLREEEHRGRFVLLHEGEQVGMMTFSRVGPTEVIVDHTETDDAIRGMGGGKRLFYALVEWARESGTSVRATCPFALAMFEKDADTRDVLAD